MMTKTIIEISKKDMVTADCVKTPVQIAKNDKICNK